MTQSEVIRLAGETRKELIARALAVRDEARKAGDYFDAEKVMAELNQRLNEAVAR
jgi:hypothetical protein